MSKFLQKIIFVLSIFIHLGYYISAYFTHTLDTFFEHVTMGQDFFQIPNAVYAFIHGGALTGDLPPEIMPYTDCCGVNSNVYHPLFTLIIGFPLQLFSPWIAFGIWATLHLLLTTITILFLWSKFSNHKHLYFALSLLLLNSYQYYEIQHAQYHFLLNLFTIFFLYAIIKTKNKIWGGILLFLSLLTKPIGVLWIIPLLIGKYFRILLIGLFLYGLVCIPFIIMPFGKYFFSNLLNVMSTPISSYNLYSLINLISIDLTAIKILSYLVAIGLILLAILKKPNIFTSVFMWTSFYLIFYSLVFHYHYSILAGLICLGILLNVFSIRRLELIPIMLITIPTPIIFFHLYGDPAILPTKHLSMIALWSIFWLIILNLFVIIKLFRKTDNKHYLSNT